MNKQPPSSPPNCSPSPNSSGRFGSKPPSYQETFISPLPSFRGYFKWIMEAEGKPSGYLASFLSGVHVVGMLHSTSVGKSIGNNLKTGSIIWQAMSPSAPVPNALHPRQLHG